MNLASLSMSSFPQEAPKNFFMTMTVYQTGAQRYGKPVPFERF